jgi:hypothetical protein
VARVRIVLPLVVLCALAAATPALAQPHVSKAQSRMISNIVERWVNDVIRGRDLADGWKIAGAAERGAIPYKAWVSGKELPVLRMEVRNNPRTSWYVTGKEGNEIFLTVSLLTGHGKNETMYDNSTTLQKIHGRWYVYAFYTDGTFRIGGKHSGSCAQASCKVTGINDYKPGGAPGGNGGATTGRISGVWADIVLGGLFSLPFLVLLVFGVIALVKRRHARRAQLAYNASSAT